MRKEILEKIRYNNINMSNLARLFKLNRSMLHMNLIGEMNNYSEHMTQIKMYVDSIDEINNKFRRI